MEKTLKQKLLDRLPKMYHDRVRDISVEDDLCDECKYMVYYTDEYTNDGECFGSCYPVRTISEAVDFIKNSLFKVNDHKH